MKKIIILISFIFSFYFTGHALATGLPLVYLRSNISEFFIGSEFEAEVFVDSKDFLNAAQIEIRYAPDQLELLSVNTNNSVIDFWKNSDEEIPGIIRLEGGSLGAFSGQSQKIASLKFKAKRRGWTRINFNLVNMYYADGLGKKISVDSQPLILNVESTMAPEIISTSKQETAQKLDITPPKITSIQIIKSPVEDISLAIFRAEDLESGIRMTQIKALFFLFWTPWIAVTSPAPIPNNAWALSFRSIDNVGNVFQEKTIYLWSNITAHIVVAAIIAGFIFLIIFFLMKATQKKQKDI